MDDTPSFEQLGDHEPSIDLETVKEALEEFAQRTGVELVTIEEPDKALIAGEISLGTRQNRIYRVTFNFPSDSPDFRKNLEKYTSGNISEIIDADNKTVELFVKLAVGMPGEALNEANGYRAIQEALGADVIPLCLFPAPNVPLDYATVHPDTHRLVITVFKSDFQTFGNMSTLFNEEGSPWESILGGAAGLHSSLCAHGDFQLRNCGQSRGNFVFIDTSYTIRLDNRKQITDAAVNAASGSPKNHLEVFFKLAGDAYRRFVMEEVDERDLYVRAVSAAAARDLVSIFTSEALLNYARNFTTERLAEFRKQLKQYLEFYFQYLQDPPHVKFQRDKIRTFIHQQIDQYYTRRR